MRRNILVEFSYDDFSYGDYSFGSYGGFGGGYGGYGGSVKGGVLGSILGGVFDAGAALVGSTKEVMRRVLTGVKMIVPILVGTFIPALQENYQKIFAEEKEDIQRIRAEYAGVYKRINDSFAGDAELFIFFAAPGAVATKYLLDKGPKILAGTLSAVTGGVFDKTLYSIAKPVGRRRQRDIFGENSEAIFSLLREEKDDGPSLKDLIGSKKFIDAVFEKSPQAKMIQRDLAEAHQKTLQKAIEVANSVLKANSIEELEAITGKKAPTEADKLLKGEAPVSPPKKKMNAKHGGKQQEQGTDEEPEAEPVVLTGEEKDMAEQQTLESTKAAIKNFYALPLKDIVKRALEMGVPKSHPFVQQHIQAIQMMGAE